MCREGEGDPHTLAQGPSVSGSKGLALGMCLASLQGLEGGGDRVPGACGGVWGHVCVWGGCRGGLCGVCGFTRFDQVGQEVFNVSISKFTQLF